MAFAFVRNVGAVAHSVAEPMFPFFCCMVVDRYPHAAKGRVAGRLGSNSGPVMADDLREKIAGERMRIRAAAGKGILDLKAIERLKVLLRELEAAEKEGSKGRVG